MIKFIVAFFIHDEISFENALKKAKITHGVLKNENNKKICLIIFL